ncbi:MAG: ribonuclease D [Candidatus Helarchaeota archaeon]
MPENKKNNPPVLITEFQALKRVVEELSTARYLAVDLESDRMYRYRIRTCLIQLAGATKQAYIVDTIELRNISLLGTLFKNPVIEKIFHDCLQDIQDLKRDFGFEVNNVFDTSVAYRFLHPGVSPGLDRLILKYFNVKISKKYQKANWGNPLTTEMLEYAANDVRYLEEIRHFLAVDLEKKGLLEEAREIFEYLASKPVVKQEFNPLSYLRIKGAMDLDLINRYRLRELYLLRENVARRIDRPTYYVLSNRTLFEIVDSSPSTKEDLLKITRKPNKFLERNAKQILSILKQEKFENEEDHIDIYKISKNRFIPRNKKNVRMNPTQEHKLKALRDYVKRKGREIHLDRGLLIPDDVLKLIVKKNPKRVEDLPDVPGFRKVKRARYGEEICTILREWKEEKTVKKKKKSKKK